MKKGKPNPNSAVLWFTPPKVPDDAPAIEETGKEKVDLLRSRDYYFGRSVAGCVAHDGLVYAADIGGVVYCFDAKTGKLYWGTRIARAIRGQLLWADGHVVVVSDDGDVAVFKHGKEKKRVLTTWIPRCGQSIGPTNCPRDTRDPMRVFPFLHQSSTQLRRYGRRHEQASRWATQPATTGSAEVVVAWAGASLLLPRRFLRLPGREIVRNLGRSDTTGHGGVRIWLALLSSQLEVLD